MFNLNGYIFKILKNLLFIWIQMLDNAKIMLYNKFSRKKLERLKKYEKLN